MVVRFRVFCENLAWADRLNQEAGNATDAPVYGVTKFSDLTRSGPLIWSPLVSLARLLGSEFRKRLGFRPRPAAEAAQRYAVLWSEHGLRHT